MPKIIIGGRKPLLPNWALATCLAGFVGVTYLYSIRAVSSDNLEQEIARQLPKTPAPHDRQSFLSLKRMKGLKLGDWQHLSPFKKHVFETCQLIPMGMVTTYGQLARILNTSPRAVGQALKQNGFASVPCHRVIRSDLSIGGFHGATDIDSQFIRNKIQLLKKEEVKFTGATTVAQECLCSDAQLQQNNESDPLNIKACLESHFKRGKN